MSVEKIALMRTAVNMLIEVIIFLESRELSFGARHFVQTESELRELLIPRRPGAAIRFCRILMFQEFTDGDTLSQ